MITTTTGSLQSIIINVINFINEFLVPLVFALAFAIFLFGVFKFFFVQGLGGKGRKEGQAFIIGSVIAFAVMLSVWGLVNLLGGTLPLNYNQPQLPSFNPSGTSNIPGMSSGLPGTSGGSSGSIQGTSQGSPSANCTNGACADVQGLY